MNRVMVIQEVINKKRAKNYLEIGVEHGYCFLNIIARRKFAVDPIFKISTLKKFLYYLVNPSSIFNKYFEMGSNEFFNSKTKILKKYPLDVVFIDGLHTYQQSLKDVENALKYIKDDGVIIMHDCLPPNEAASYPARSFEEAESLNLPGWTAEWCGDVWKTIVYLKSNRSDLKVFVLNCDSGIGVVTRGIENKPLNYALEQIDNLTYKDMEKDQDKLLNLKNPQYIYEFVNSNLKSSGRKAYIHRILYWIWSKRPKF